MGDFGDLIDLGLKIFATYAVVGGSILVAIGGLIFWAIR